MANNFKVRDLIADNIYISENNGNVVNTFGDQLIRGDKIFSGSNLFTGDSVSIETTGLNNFGSNSNQNNFGSNSNQNNFGSNSNQNNFGLSGINNKYYSGEFLGNFTFDSIPKISGSVFVTDFVTTTRNQTISGQKTFTQIPKVSGYNCIIDNLDYMPTLTGNPPDIKNVFYGLNPYSKSDFIVNSFSESVFFYENDPEILQEIKIHNVGCRSWDVSYGTSPPSTLISVKPLTSASFYLYKSSTGSPLTIYNFSPSEIRYDQLGVLKDTEAVNALYDQTITGVKNFKSRPTVNGIAVLISGDNPSGYITGISNIVFTTGDQTISGIKTFATGVNISGNVNISGATTMTGSLTTTGPTVFNSTSVTAPNLTPSASNSLMTRSSTEEFLLWTPNIMQYFPIAGSTTNGGIVSVSAGQSAQIVLGTQSSGTARLTLVSDWQFSNAAGSSMRFDRPFKIRIPMNCNMNYPDTSGQAACRVYVGSNGSFTLPYAGQESYPTGTRGVGVEWRKASGSFQQEFRLFARNGTSTTTGQFIATNYTGFGPISNSNSKFYDLLLAFNVDAPTNPIVNLYGSAWEGSTNLPPARTSSTPILTLSGSGVPTGSASVAINWGRVEAVVVGDNGPIPPQASTALNYFRTIYLQQA